MGQVLLHMDAAGIHHAVQQVVPLEDEHQQHQCEHHAHDAGQADKQSAAQEHRDAVQAAHDSL